MIVSFRKAGTFSLKKPWDTGANYVANRVNWEIRFFLGEWFMDQNAGVPWVRDVFRRGIVADVVSAVLRRTLLNTPGVLRVRSISVLPGAQPRSMIVRYSFVSTDGSTVDNESNVSV
jgi:hypothetical protein